MKDKDCLNPKCQYEAGPEDIYCSRCGWPLPRICLNCDLENPPHLTHCAGCNTIIGAFPNESVITKRVWPKFFDAIKSGQKKFELRLNNFHVQNGDMLILAEYDPETEALTGRWLLREVTHVLKFKPDELPFWSKEDVATYGLQIISLG